MLFYFSATGNTEHVVEEIKTNGESVVFIPDAIKKGTFDFDVMDNRIGILSPTYFWGLPSIVKNFLEKAHFNYKGKPYCFYVATCGTTPGSSGSIAKDLLKNKGLSLDACFDIKMPDTWTVIFDVSNKKKIDKKLLKSDIEIQKLQCQLKKQITGNHMGLTTPRFVADHYQKTYDNKVRKTRNLSVSNSCIGCGICAKNCPVQAIEIKDKKPVWITEFCVMCLGCLHRCPGHAIYYGNGKATNSHGQYTFPSERKKMETE